MQTITVFAALKPLCAMALMAVLCVAGGPVSSSFHSGGQNAGQENMIFNVQIMLATMQYFAVIYMCGMYMFSAIYGSTGRGCTTPVMGLKV